MPTFAESRNADGNRSTRSAAVGPAATSAHGFSDDLEGQGAVAKRARGVVTGPTILDAEEAGLDDLDDDPDDVETNMSVFTFLKIVSAWKRNVHTVSVRENV